MVRETPDTSSLPLIEARAHALGLPGAFSLHRELAAAGYYRVGLLEQWKTCAAMLLAHLRETPDPLTRAQALAADPEPRLRFHAPALYSELLAEDPRAVLRLLVPLAADPDDRVREAVQAFGVRPQAESLGPDVVPELLPWVRDPRPAVRRAALEGVRPRGIWVRRLAWTEGSPGSLLPLLEEVRHEDQLYPAHALANALNDLSKSHPRLVVDLLRRWGSESEVGPLFPRICRKALRTLIKEGDPFALALLGLGPLDVDVRVRLRNGPRVGPNQGLVFELVVRNRGAAADAQLVYEIRTPGRHPDRPRRRRYRGRRLRLPARGELQVLVRERIFDTRAAPLLPGACEARFFLNGRECARCPFRLERKDRTQA